MRFLAFALIVLILNGCTGNPQYQTQILPNGKEVKIIGITKMYSTNGVNKWLILNYQTDLPIDDVPALTKEVDLIWPYFKNDVEKAGMAEAAITATSAPTGFIVQQSNTHTFAFKKGADGKWSGVGD